MYSSRLYRRSLCTRRQANLLTSLVGRLPSLTRSHRTRSLAGNLLRSRNPGMNSKTHQTAPGTLYNNATLYEDRKAHQVRSRQRNQKTTPSEINCPALQPPLTQLQHVSPMAAALQEKLYVMSISKLAALIHR
jgi:hypothetical protein